MTISTEQIYKIPGEYLTFLQVLWAVVRSREDESVPEVSGIPFWMIYRVVSERHGYSEHQVRQLAENLKSRGWIQEDKLGFFTPCGRGIEILQSLNPQTSTTTTAPPALPEF
jgi:hypothetical protein